MKVFPPTRRPTPRRRRSCPRRSARKDLAGPPADDPGRARRLHRLRRVRRRLPGEVSKTEVRHKAINMEPVARPPRRRAARAGTSSCRSRQLDRDLLAARLGQGLAGARAAVRVLRRLRRLRRDAVPQARHPAVRRPDDRRQRHRLLVDLRRQPADHAVDVERRRPRPGVEQLAVRGQRRVRPRHAARARRPGRAGPPAARAARARPSATDARPRARSTPTRTTEAGIAAQRERVAALRDRPWPAIDGDARADARQLLALADDLVRKGVWIIGGDGWAYDIGFGGLDHVLSARAATSTSSCSTPRSTRTPAARRRRRRRAAPWPSSPPPARRAAKKDLGAIARAYGNVYVAQIAHRRQRRSRRPRRCSRPRRGPGRRWSSPTRPASPTASTWRTSMSHQKDAVKSGYWPLYRFQPSRGRGRPPVQARLRRRRRSRSPSSWPTETRFAVLARTHPERAAELAELAQADADERWRYYSSSPAIERTVPARRQARASDAGERMSVDLRTRYLGPRAAVADRRLGGARSTATSRTRSALERGRRRGDRPAVAVRGGDRPRGGRADRRARSTGPSQFAEALDYFPAIDRFTDAAERYLDGHRRGSRTRSTVPVIASLNASTRRRLGALRPAARGRRRRRPRAQPVPRRRRPRAIGRGGRGRPTSTSSPPCATPSPSRSRSSSRRTTRRSPTSPTAVLRAGADGLVLFNRFYQPDLDLDTLEVVPADRPEHTRRAAPAAALDRAPARRRSRARRGWPPRPACTRAATWSRRSLVGADVAMMTSAVLRHGPGHVARRRGRAPPVARRPGVPVGRRAARQRGHRDGAGPARDRARQLPRHAAVVDDAGLADAGRRVVTGRRLACPGRRT